MSDSSFKLNMLKMLSFGIAAALAASITFSVPGIEGGVSDPREIIALIGIVYLSHGIYAVGLGLLAALGGPYDNLLTTIVMHITAIPCAWVFLSIIKKRIKNLSILGVTWFCFILVLYIAVFSSVFVFSELLFGHIELSNAGYVFKAFITGVKFEAVLTALITALAITIISVLKREKESLRLAFEALKESEERFKSLAEELPVAVFETDLNIQVTYANRKAVESFGYSTEEMLGGLNGLELFVPEDRDRVRQNVSGRIQGKIGQVNEYQALRKDGSTFLIMSYSSQIIQGGKVTGVRGFLVDITEREQAVEKHLQSITQTAEQHEYQAHHHPLTGLPNRLLLYARLEHSIQHVKREKEHGAVLFLDLDDFKKINDSLGHSAGDMVLKEVAQRLQRHSREVDTVAHLGGDEFVIVLQSAHSVRDAESRAQQILETLSEPILYGEKGLHVSVSIGIAEFDGDCDSIEDLLECADVAMYKAKEAGKNCCQLYSSDFTAATIKKVI